MSLPSRPGSSAVIAAPAIQDAVQMIRSSRQALPAAAARRAMAVAAAQHALDAAFATERAEQDAARSALLAGVRRLTAAGLDDSEITGLCGHGAPTDRAADGGPNATNGLRLDALQPGDEAEPLRKQSWATCRMPLIAGDRHPTRPGRRKNAVRRTAAYTMDQQKEGQR